LIIRADDVAIHTRGVTQWAAQAKTLRRGGLDFGDGALPSPGDGGSGRIRRQVEGTWAPKRTVYEAPSTQPDGSAKGMVRSPGLGALVLFETLKLLI
jgi:hypothetical protein